jgi:hypothetical protein
LGLAALACAVLICVSAASHARSAEPHLYDEPHGSATPASRTDTLWIFDADFEDLAGDNTGWVSEDLSGTLGFTNHWHKDTIRINGFEHLGDSTWWCGTYDHCWRQPRGYGNSWRDILIREFPEVAVHTDPGDTLILEYDQRYAMEKDYDFGYTGVSTDGGLSWTTVHTVNNPGFGGAGTSQDWDSIYPTGPGHMSLDLSAYAGLPISLRFRFESDVSYSSQDMYDNPLHSVKDGAWQIDNIALYNTHPSRGEPFWLDDCESPGDNGWVHKDIPPSGQTGVSYYRSLENFDGHSGWMMASYDSLLGRMVDDQYARLYAPPIDLSGAPALVVRFEGWLDLPTEGGGHAGLYLHVSNHEFADCVWYAAGLGPDPVWESHLGGPEWIEFEDDWSAATDWRWLGCEFRLTGGDVGAAHGVGFVLDRLRIGIPLGTGTPDGDALSDKIRAVRPNPFNPLTTVEFEIAVKGRAALRVYDIAGRLVTTLRDGEVEPGEYEATWDGTDDSGERVASGVYMLRLEVGGGASASTKAVLLK